jgi:hypothetical protein
MKLLRYIPLFNNTKIWLLSLFLLSPLLFSACTKDESTPFYPQNTLTSKLFVVGSQVDNNGDLVLFVNGTDANGDPLTETDLQNAKVTVTTTTGSTEYINGNPELSIQPVTVGDKILSLSLITDYSGSIEDAALNDIGDVFRTILLNLPLVYEAQIINFSDTYHLEIDWTDAAINYDGIVAATYRDDAINRNGTALYDTIGFALLNDPLIIGTPTTQGDGLIERCRPARMMIVFSDGLENPQPNSPGVYTDINELTAMIESSETISIMLGTSNADLATLQTLAGSRGAVVQILNTAGIKTEITNWAQSLNYMAKFSLTAASEFSGNTVTISLNDQVVTVAQPSDAFCKIAQ